MNTHTWATRVIKTITFIALAILATLFLSDSVSKPEPETYFLIESNTDIIHISTTGELTQHQAPVNIKLQSGFVKGLPWSTNVYYVDKWGNKNLSDPLNRSTGINSCKIDHGEDGNKRCWDLTPLEDRALSYL